MGSHKTPTFGNVDSNNCPQCLLLYGVCVCILEAYNVCAGVEIRAFWACERCADWDANFDQIIILLMKTSGRRLFVDKQAYDYIVHDWYSLCVCLYRPRIAIHTKQLTFYGPIQLVFVRWSFRLTFINHHIDWCVPCLHAWCFKKKQNNSGYLFVCQLCALQTLFLLFVMNTTNCWNLRFISSMATFFFKFQMS